MTKTSRHWITIAVLGCVLAILLAASSVLHNTPPANLLPERIYAANLWMQTSAEYRAICLQTFRIALSQVQKTVENASHREGRSVADDGKRMAVVTDLDETILDNSRFRSEVAIRGLRSSPQLWTRWVVNNFEDVEFIPGAKAFIDEIEKLGVIMVYLSNRPDSERDSTIKALAHLGIHTEGLAEASERRLLLHKDEPDKESRRQLAAEKFHVVAYLGDNLGDFPGSSGPEIESRYQKVQQHEELLGTQWFVLPNPAYGDWETPILNDPRGHLKRTSNLRFVEGP
jgi:5'-nucleotidase (lipoprotein e(P4) family)